jgi:hypothetical protein
MKNAVRVGTLLMLTLGAIAVSTARAQLAPDTPRLVSPYGPGAGAFGVHWIRAGTLPGDGDAVLVTWAPLSLPDGMRIRAGAGTGANGDIAGFGGLDVQTPLIRGDGSRPVDLDWYTGIGVAARNYALVTVPAGISAGISWTSGAVWMSPYVAAGLAADLRLGEDAPESEFEVHPAVDLGLDLSLDGARRVILRTAASFGDRQSLAAGVALGGGRRSSGGVE